MQRASILQAVLLSVATLQMQSASGSPMTWAKPVRVQALFTSDIVEKAEKYVKVRIAIEHFGNWYDNSLIYVLILMNNFFYFRTD